MIVLAGFSACLKLEVLLRIGCELGIAEKGVVGLSDADFLTGAAGVVGAVLKVLLRVELERGEMEGLSLKVGSSDHVVRGILQ